MATLGVEGWGSVTGALNELFPGSCVGVVNFDPVSNTIPFMDFAGVSAAQSLPYAEYYYKINPFEKFWNMNGDGQVWTSDSAMSLQQLAKEEYFVDFLSKLGDFASGIGMKVAADVDSEIRLIVQFSPNMNAQYQDPARALFSRLRSPLRRAILTASSIRERQDKIAAVSSLQQRQGKAAFIVDRYSRLKEANAEFEKLLSASDVFSCKQGRISIVGGSQTETFDAVVSDLSKSACSDHAQLYIQNDWDQWLLTFSRLPTIRDPSILRSQPQILVVATRLGLPVDVPDCHDLVRCFDLTIAEQRLCQAFAASFNLSEAAQICGISYETARSRLKDIFRKTNTNKQSELLLLIGQFCNC